MPHELLPDLLPPFLSATELELMEIYYKEKAATHG